MGHENTDSWGTLREEDIEYEEVRETSEQLSLFGIRRRLVVMYPQLGTRTLTTPWQPLETTIAEEGEGELEVLMKSVGLEVKEIYGDYDLRPLTRQSEKIIYRIQRA